MKTRSLNGLSPLLLAAVLAGLTAPALRAQLVVWPFQNFDGNICGWNSYTGVTLTYDPTQDNTGDGGGSCHVSTDYSQSGLFQITAADVACCFCLTEASLQLSNYNFVDFDVKWDNSSTVPLSFFNTNFGSGTQGIVIGASSNYNFGPGICFSNFIIPDAATNGWVHMSMAINNTGPVFYIVGLGFEKAFPAYGNTTTAAFWLDNVQLVGPTIQPTLSPSSQGSNFTVYFSAIQGATYSVLKSSEFTHWTNLVTGYPQGGAAANTILSFTDTNASGGQAYYRVRSP